MDDKPCMLVDARSVIAWAGCKRKCAGSLYFNELRDRQRDKGGADDKEMWGAHVCERGVPYDQRTDFLHTRKREF
jgi:hypothetical protein